MVHFDDLSEICEVGYLGPDLASYCQLLLPSVIFQRFGAFLAIRSKKMDEKFQHYHEIGVP